MEDRSLIRSRILEELDVLAFDPGTTGGMFCMINYGEIEFMPLPVQPGKKLPRIDYDATFTLLDQSIGLDTQCVIEDVWVRSAQGANSSAKFIETYAAVRGMMNAISGKPVTTLRPQSWKPQWGIAGKQKDPKGSARYVEKHFPDLVDLMPRLGKTSKVLGVDINKADAFLIALTPSRMRAAVSGP